MKKGIALLWSLVLTTVLMIITGSMATVMIRESQMVVDLVDSNQAYYNAKTGIEWGEHYVSHIGAKAPVAVNDAKIFNFTYPESGRSEVKITKTGIGTYKIESEGKGIDDKNTRKIIHDWVPGGGWGANLINKAAFDAGTAPDEIGLGNTNTNSFDITFDFWIDPALGVSPNDITLIGVDRQNGNRPGIGLAITGGKPEIFWRQGGTNHTKPIPIVGDTIKPGTTDMTRSYTYRAKINYLDESRIYAVIEQAMPDFSGYICIGYATADVSGVGFGTMPTIGARMSSGTPALRKSNFSTLYRGEPYYLEMGNITVAKFYFRKPSP